MNDYEISKLKKQLARKQELLKEEQRDREDTEKALIAMQAERDRYHGQLVIARQTIENVDQIIAMNVQDMRMKLQQENKESNSEVEQLRRSIHQEKIINEKLLQELRTKDAVITEYSLRLKEMSKKYKDPSMIINLREASEQAMITHNSFYKLTEKYNKLSTDMENIMAENKILRKLHAVPDNFGFDLDEIKIAEKQELEDYKAQCRRLETEIEQLEAERTQLRYRLRQYNNLYSNKGERYKDMTQQQFEMLDLYAMNLKEGKIEMPQIDKSQKEMEKLIIQLRAKLEILQSRAPMGSTVRASGPLQSEVGEKVSMETLKKFQQQVKSVLQPFVQDIKRFSQIQASTLAATSNQGNNPNVNNATLIQQPFQAQSQLYRPPMPLPHAHNDFSQIKQGYSFAYASKIPTNMKGVEGQLGFNQTKSRYMVAALQLQNIESMKLLKQKQSVESKLLGELNELKQKYVKCLKVQDALFLRYFEEREKVNDRIKKLQIEKRQITNEKEQLEANHDVLSDAYNLLVKKADRTALETKCSDQATRLGISEANVVRLQQKYNVLNEQSKLLRQAYTNLEAKSANECFTLREKYLRCKKNERELTVLMSQIMQDARDSVSSDVHKSLLSRMQSMNDKSVGLAFKQSQLRLRICKLQSIERQMNIKDEVIESLREDNFDINLQLEIMKGRLQAVDSTYKGYKITLDRLVRFINDKNVSLLSCFKKFDRDGSGELGKNEFQDALRHLGFDASNNEMEVMFSQFDLDGSQSITYKQFMRKLRRNGVMTRSKEQQALFNLYRAIKHANISLRKAFQIIDLDGSNEVSKSEMETAFRKIGIQVKSSTVDYIFQMCDGDMNGKISCLEFEKIFEEVVKDSAIEQKQLYAVQMDWKLQFVLQIEQCSQKYHSSLQETFKVLDGDGNSSLSMQQLSNFIQKAGIKIDRKSLIELFDFLDRRRDKKVQYGQFLKVLQEAKSEKKKITRMKAIKQRTEQLRKQYDVAMVREGERFKIGEEASLKVRLMSLETKQASLMKKNEKIVKSIVAKEQQIMDLEREVAEKQKEMLKIKDEYFKQKQLACQLQERLKSSLTEEQSKRIDGDNKAMKIKILEQETQLQLYKGLYEGLCVRNKADEMRVGKIEAERNKYYEIVKDLQANSNLQAQAASKTIELEYSKRNEEIINKKYQQIVDQLRKINEQNTRLTELTMEKQRQIINAHIFLQEKSSLQNRTIDSLTAKVLPTVNPSRVEEILIRVREVTSSKSQLEQENKELREKNFNLMLRNDYIENERVHIEALQQKLKRTYTDQSSVTIIDLTKKLSEYKMGELRAKRECGLLKEKEEYYMRVHNATNDSVTELEEQLAQWEVKFNAREEFWRKRISEQMKLMEDLQKEAAKAKEEQRNAQNFFKRQHMEQQQNSRKYSALPSQKKSQLDNYIRKPTSINNTSQSIPLQWRTQMQQLQNELQSKSKQIYQLKTALKEIVPEGKFTDFGSQMRVSTNSFVLQTDLTTSQLQNNAKRFLNAQRDQQNFYKDETVRLTQAAQQSIDTLQRIIDDKNEQLRRKEKIIDDLKRQLLKTKQEDYREMQKLYDQIATLKAAKNTQLSSDMPTSKNFYRVGQQSKEGKSETQVAALRKALTQKEQELSVLQDKYDNLLLSKQKKSAEQGMLAGKAIERKLQQLQEEREQQKRKYYASEEQLRLKIKTLQKLSKEKDGKLARLSSTFQELKREVVNEKSRNEREGQESLEQMIGVMNKGTHANESKMEIMLQKSLQTIQQLTKKNRQCEGEIRRLKEDKMGKTMNKR